MATATSHKTRQSSQKKSAKKSVKRANAKKSNRCWPGFEPVPGKRPGTKGSCKREPGPHSKATRHATQKAAAASKLEKRG
jgi:hypothetical protein